MKKQKEKKVLENTKATDTFVVEAEHGVIREIGHSAIIQPNVQFSGKPMNWFDDSKLLKK